MIAEIRKLSVAERLQLVEEIWDSIAETPEEVPITDEQLEEIRRRVEAHKLNPQEGVSWEEVEAKMRMRRAVKP